MLSVEDCFTGQWRVEDLQTRCRHVVIHIGLLPTNSPKKDLFAGHFNWLILPCKVFPLQRWMDGWMGGWLALGLALSAPAKRELPG
jgi:hypothetical protein